MPDPESRLPTVTALFDLALGVYVHEFDLSGSRSGSGDRDGIGHVTNKTDHSTRHKQLGRGLSTSPLKLNASISNGECGTMVDDLKRPLN